jgi:hypothetical protein
VHQFLLLLDPSKKEPVVMAECGSCGAIARGTIETAWVDRAFSCECGITMTLAPNDFVQLHESSARAENMLRKLLRMH